jgi:hypothetical protein
MCGHQHKDTRNRKRNTTLPKEKSHSPEIDHNLKEIVKCLKENLK